MHSGRLKLVLRNWMVVLTPEQNRIAAWRDRVIAVALQDLYAREQTCLEALSAARGDYGAPDDQTLKSADIPCDEHDEMHGGLQEECETYVRDSAT